MDQEISSINFSQGKGLLNGFGAQLSLASLANNFQVEGWGPPNLQIEMNYFLNKLLTYIQT